MLSIIDDINESNVSNDCRILVCFDVVNKVLSIDNKTCLEAIRKLLMEWNIDFPPTRVFNRSIEILFRMQ